MVSSAHVYTWEVKKGSTGEDLHVLSKNGKPAGVVGPHNDGFMLASEFVVGRAATLAIAKAMLLEVVMHAKLFDPSQN